MVGYFIIREPRTKTNKSKGYHWATKPKRPLKFLKKHR